MANNVAGYFHFRLAQDANVQRSGKFTDIVAAQIEQSQGFGDAEKAHFLKFQVGNGAAAVHAEAACIGVQLVA